MARPNGGIGAGLVARGAVLYEGKLIRQTLDNHVLALDMKTGKASATDKGRAAISQEA